MTPGSHLQAFWHTSNVLDGHISQLHEPAVLKLRCAVAFLWSLSCMCSMRRSRLSFVRRPAEERQRTEKPVGGDRAGTFECKAH